MERPDVIVVGGGLSGLTYAHFAAKKGKQVLVLEGDEAPGGCIRTVYPYPGYYMEIGGHTIYNSYATIIEMMADLGLQDDIVQQKKCGYLMHTDSGIRSFFSVMDIAGCFLALLKFPFYKKKGKSVKEYYGGLFGAKNFNNMIRPMTSAVICQDSSDFSAELLLKSRPKNTKLPRSFNMKKGLRSVFEAAASQKGVKTVYSAKVTRIDKEKDGWKVYAGDNVYSADELAMAVPAPVAAELSAQWAPALSSVLKELPTVRSNAYGFALKKDDYLFREFSYIISNAGKFRGLVSMDTIPNDVYRSATFHFDTSVDAGAEFNKMKPVLQINQQADVYTASHVFTLPKLLPSHPEWLARLTAASDDVGRFHLLGNFFGGMSMEDCAVRAKERGML